MPEIKKYKILCVDDNANNLFTLSVLLKQLQEIQIIEALSAKEGLAVVLKEEIDLILCDVQMPEMNGFEFAQMLKSSKKTRDIPIVFLTAVFKSDEFVHYGFEVGATDYLTKPIDDNQLLNKIRLYIKLFHQRDQALDNEKRFYNIAQSIQDGIYAIDTDAKATFVNNEALRLLGYEKDELLGKVIHDYIHYKDRHGNPVSAKVCKIHKAMQVGEFFSSESEYFVKKNGSFLKASVQATPLFEDGKVVGSVVVFRDLSIKEKVMALEEERSKTQEQIIHSMVEMIESRDSYTAGHTRRVAHYCVLIAKEMHYLDEDIELLQRAAWLHDIGKISTPDSVLLKPAKLNNMEYKLIQEHLNAGYELLRKIDAYQEIAKIMREHHERYDGAGYPQGLQKDEIHPLSRIMIVADAFDAMTTNRVYKPRKSVADALKELQELSAVQFHPEVVSAALIALKNIVIDENIDQAPKTALEEQRFAYFYRDRLTGLFLIEYLYLLIRYSYKDKSVYFYKINLRNFTEYNRRYGWSAGDAFLIEFAHLLQTIDNKAVVFRIEGDDFLLMSKKRIGAIKDKISNFSPMQGGIVSFEVQERFVKNLQETHLEEIGSWQDSLFF